MRPIDKAGLEKDKLFVAHWRHPRDEPFGGIPMLGHETYVFQSPSADAGTVPMRRFPGPQSAFDARAVMVGAYELEHDTRRLLAWFAEAPIACLGGRTAAELVGEGQGALVVRFSEGFRAKRFQKDTAWVGSQCPRAP